ncbi:MAG: LpxI family protein, partial [Candidatus Adiutrix sp.]
MKAPIGLIAGNRSLPMMVAQKAQQLGHPLFVAAIENEADCALEPLAQGFTRLKLGQMQSLIDFFAKAHVHNLIMIGGISRESILLNYEPDEVALEIMAQLNDFHTDKILTAVARHLETVGLHLSSVAELMPELLAQPGVLTKKAPDKDMIADLKIAFRMAKELGRLDVGQCAVVSDTITLALEAAEGTDETVKRGGLLAHKPVAVAKVVKPMQDLRLDPPVIGPDTVRTMAQANVGALVIDAFKVLIIEQEETIRL